MLRIFRGAGLDFASLVGRDTQTRAYPRLDETTRAYAATLERVGAAIHVPQSQLSVERLDTTIRRLLENPLELDRLARGAAARARPHAADDIAQHILALVDHAGA